MTLFSVMFMCTLPHLMTLLNFLPQKINEIKAFGKYINFERIIYIDVSINICFFEY